jgi:hypothetical protein
MSEIQRFEAWARETRERPEVGKMVSVLQHELAALGTSEAREAWLGKLWDITLAAEIDGVTVTVERLEALIAEARKCG